MMCFAYATFKTHAKTSETGINKSRNNIYATVFSKPPEKPYLCKAQR